MTGQRYYTPNPFEITPTGAPLAGGQLFTYATGSATPLATYSDAALSVPNSNPIVADANGRFGSIFLGSSQAYKIQLFTAIPAGTSQSDSTPSSPLGTQIWSEDPCGPAAGGNAASAGFIGQVMPFAGLASAIPSQWYQCYGQAVSRTTYAAAFAVIGTIWGTGDGSTTFNLPDLRGRSIFGLDNMGGTAAGRVTSGVSGIAGATLGASGGSQNAQADTPTATSTVTDPTHSHPTSCTGTGTMDGTNFLQGGTTWDLIRGVATTSVATGITVTTTVTSSLTGSSQNMPPAAIGLWLIYLGA